MVAWRCKRGCDESVIFQQDLIALEWGRHTHRVYFSDRCDKLPFTAGESREAIESQLPAVQFAIVACLRGCRAKRAVEHLAVRTSACRNRGKAAARRKQP